MEFIEITLYSVKTVLHLALTHPVYAFIGSLLGLILLIGFYCRLSVGICSCDVDMTGKTVIVTGANAGIGKETAREIAKKGARVIMACRSKTRGEEALKEIRSSTGNSNIELKLLDLCSFASVRAFASDILKNEKRLDVLINNAGAYGSSSREITDDGCEKTMQANHLGHFLLTLLLLDFLKKSPPSRIINVSSEGHKFAKLRIDVMNSSRAPYKPGLAYCNSKAANILFTNELAMRLVGTDVTVNSLHPGVVKTELLTGSTMTTIIGKILCLILGKTPLEGAQTSIHLAVAPKLAKVSGKYFGDCKQKKTSKWVQDDTRARRLWHISELLVGLTYKEKTTSTF